MWACLACQNSGDQVEAAVAVQKPFLSHCAGEPLEYRKKNSVHKLTVAELRQELRRFGLSHTGKKSVLVERLGGHIQDLQEHTADLDLSSKIEQNHQVHGYHHTLKRKRRRMSRTEERTPQKAKNATRMSTRKLF